MESQSSQEEPTPDRLPFFAFAGHRWVTARHLETATATAIATTANQTWRPPSSPPLGPPLQSTEGATTTTSAAEGGDDKDKSPASTSVPSSSSSSVPLAQSRDDVTAARATGAPLPPLLFNTLHLISWNIDFSTPEDGARMAAALNHLHSLVKTIDSTGAVVIFLQENMTADLELISAAEWVRNRFYITDLRTHGYGTAALVDRRLVIGGDGVQRLRLVSRFGRDGLLIDLAVRSVGGEGDGQHKVLRLCNVHLESLGHIPPVRPVQFAALAPLLEPSRSVHGSIMAGDMNAIRPYDETLPAEHGLSDAYLALGGVEGAPEGNTWGYQSGRTRFSPGRLDKVLFAGGVTPRSLERIGVGVVVEDGVALHRLREMGAQEFATDHYGLHAEFALDGVALVGGQEEWRACCAPDRCDCASQPVARPAVYNLWKLGSSTA